MGASRGRGAYIDWAEYAGRAEYADRPARVITSRTARKARGAMSIRRSIPTDRDVLVDIWLRSVRATHTFLSEEDIQSLLPLARDYLTSDEPEFWVRCSDSGAIMGF